LLSIPYKAFCTIVNLEWTEGMGILCEEQNGFRSIRGCLEIFALISVMEHRKQVKTFP